MRRGFTLIELSIVIVIIGLIVAGVVGGQSVIKQAKLKTIIQDVNKYTVANHMFLLKYDEYAGDMLSANTTTYWGVSNTGNESWSPRGDKKIAAGLEGVRSFYHMQLAGILKGGSYDGVFITDEVAGVTVGKSRYSENAGFNFHTFGVTGNYWSHGTSDVYDMIGDTVIFFGKIHPGAGS